MILPPIPGGPRPDSFVVQSRKAGLSPPFSHAPPPLDRRLRRCIPESWGADSSRTGREDDPATRAAGDASGGTVSSNSVQWRGNMPRRMSSMEEVMMRHKQITAASFQHGLTTLGFNLTEEASRAVRSVA